MLHKAVQVRIYPCKEQETQLAQAFGCARWWWNYALNKSIETYKETGKGLSHAALRTFTNFLAYKLERKGGKLVEIDRWFPSSKLCSNCFYQIGDMPLDVREWTCPHCGTHHDRDGNAAINIRTEGIRMLALSEVEGIKAEGSAVWCCRRGDKTKTWAKV